MTQATVEAVDTASILPGSESDPRPHRLIVHPCDAHSHSGECGSCQGNPNNSDYFAKAEALTRPEWTDDVLLAGNRFQKNEYRPHESASHSRQF
jgi:hypothetical protein